MKIAEEHQPASNSPRLTEMLDHLRFRRQVMGHRGREDHVERVVIKGKFRHRTNHVTSARIELGSNRAEIQIGEFPGPSLFRGPRTEYPTELTIPGAQIQDPEALADRLPQQVRNPKPERTFESGQRVEPFQSAIVRADLLGRSIVSVKVFRLHRSMPQKHCRSLIAMPLPEQVSSTPPPVRRHWALRVAILAGTAYLFAWACGAAMLADSKLSTPPGLFRGMLHGAMMPVAWPALLAGHEQEIYARVNTGVPYKLGYSLGVNASGLFFFGWLFLSLGGFRKGTKR